MQGSQDFVWFAITLPGKKCAARSCASTDRAWRVGSSNPSLHAVQNSVLSPSMCRPLKADWNTSPRRRASRLLRKSSLHSCQHQAATCVARLRTSNPLPGSRLLPPLQHLSPQRISKKLQVSCQTILLKGLQRLLVWMSSAQIVWMLIVERVGRRISMVYGIKSSNSHEMDTVLLKFYPRYVL